MIASGNNILDGSAFEFTNRSVKRAGAADNLLTSYLVVRSEDLALTNQSPLVYTRCNESGKQERRLADS